MILKRVLTREESEQCLREGNTKTEAEVGVIRGHEARNVGDPGS